MEQVTKNISTQTLGLLTILVGLPGSGKSTYIAKLIKSNPDLSVYDDYQGEAYGDDSDPRLSKHFGPLVHDLKNVKSVIVSDIRFCIPRELNIFLSAILSAEPDVRIAFTYFENNPDACRKNILARNREDRIEKELDLLEKLSASYEIPVVEHLRVYDSSL